MVFVHGYMHVLLGIGLLQQGTPELVCISRVDEDEPAIVGRETVVHNNVHPFTKVPESKVEDASIALIKALVVRYNLFGERERERERELVS